MCALYASMRPKPILLSLTTETPHVYVDRIFEGSNRVTALSAGCAFGLFKKLSACSQYA